MSLRALSRLGSSLSLFGTSRLGASLSVLAFPHLGASVSLRSFARLGASLSILDSAHVGSSLSLRSFARLGSALSIFGMVRFGSSLSIFDCASLGASISLRSFARLGSSVSILDYGKLGASLSLRGFGRLGSTLSLFGMTRLASSLSVVEFSNLGSSVSLRSFARLGSALSIFDFAHLGSSLSIRGIARFGGRIEVFEKLRFTSDTNYIIEKNSGVEFYVANARGMHIGDGTSTNLNKLHGTWVADSTISQSDRRLKDNIRPLSYALEQNLKKGDTEGDSEPVRPAASWVLRQLRPVSYNFKKGMEAKFMRFGFIADEVEQVLPQVVREVEDHIGEESEGKQKIKGIVYTDLIAVLTTIIKDLNLQMKGMQSRMTAAEGELARLDEEDPIDDDFESFFDSWMGRQLPESRQNKMV